MARGKVGKKASKKTSKVGDFTNDFMMDLIKESGNNLASRMDEETLSTTTEYISTGSLALNGLLVSDILKGIPNNKTIAFAGEEGCGKTFLALECVKHRINTGGIVCFFDSENAVDSAALRERGIDTSKVMYYPIATVQEFRDQVMKIVNKYNATPESKRPKLMIVLDSLGNLSTKKEMEDVESGTDKRDMTRAQVIKSIFRVLNLKLAKAKIPTIITNHVYDQIGGFIPQKILSGGSGLKYAASTIIFIIKSKAKDSKNNVVGIYMNCRTVKNRFCTPDAKLKIYLNFSTGLHPYYGLQTFGEPILKKESKGWSLNGEKITEKKLWSMDWPDELIQVCGKNISDAFSFGEASEVTLDQVTEDGEE